MRRYWITPEWKRRIRRKSGWEIERRRSKNRRACVEGRREYRRNEKQHKLNKEGQASVAQLKPRNREKFKNLPSPRNFSLVENTEEILRYFAQARAEIAERRQISINMADILRLTPDAIALLVAQVNNRKFTRGLAIKGLSPNSEPLRHMLVESGFYDHVQSEIRKPPHPRSILLHRETERKVEPDLAREACIKAIAFTLKTEEKFQPLYEILIECMANTHNHASPNREGQRNWWLFVYNDPKRGLTSFSFLDLGIGIFESIPFQGFRKGILGGRIPNHQLVDRLLRGEISSRTEKKERGKGFPLIYAHSHNPLIKNFTIISNDVYANIEKKQYREISEHLDGTFLYWELHPRTNSERSL